MHRLGFMLVLTGITALGGACARPLVVLTIHDPDGVAAEATEITLSAMDGGISRTASVSGDFPLTWNLRSDEPGARRQLWVAALLPDGSEVGRGKVSVVFPRSDARARFSVNLYAVCSRVTASETDGRTCALDDPQLFGTGICLGDACNLSRCGDGFVDEAGEQCDDGNDNPNDGCHACSTTSWSAEVISGLGAGSGSPNTADIRQPLAVETDSLGNTFIALGLEPKVLVLSTDGRIVRVAGGGSDPAGEGIPAVEAAFMEIADLAVDGVGNLYIADQGRHVVRHVDPYSGTITTVAGTGQPGAIGDGGPASAAQLNEPVGIAVDGLGNIFIAERLNHSIRRVDALDGTITRIAGGGSVPVLTFDVDGQIVGDADGTAALDVELLHPSGLDVDHDASRLVVVRKAQTSTSFSITTESVVVAFALDEVDAPIEVFESTYATHTVGMGNRRGLTGYVFHPFHALLETRSGPSTAVYFSHGIEGVVGRFDMLTGDLTTVAGGGVGEPPGIPAVDAALRPTGLAWDHQGRLLIADTLHDQLLALDSGAELTSVAGSAGAVFDSGAMATSISLGDGTLQQRHGGLWKTDDYLYVAVGSLSRVFRVELATGLLELVAGNGRLCPWEFPKADCGDGSDPRTVALGEPAGVAVSSDGVLYVADSGTGLRRILLHTTPWKIETLIEPWSPDGSTWFDPSALYLVNTPGAADSHVLYASVSLSSAGLSLVRIAPDGTLGVIAGAAGSCTTPPPSCGDGGDPLLATLRAPASLVADANGVITFVDGNTVRRIASGTITTIAGDGISCDRTADPTCSDGAAATEAQLLPMGLWVDANGTVTIGDRTDGSGGASSGWVRQFEVGGTIATVAGGGSQTDGTAALATWLDTPLALVGTATGFAVLTSRRDSVFVDSQFRVRHVDTTNDRVTTWAGKVDPDGDGRASDSSLLAPFAVSHLDASRLLIVDRGEGRVRMLDESSELLTTRVGYPNGFEGVSEARFSRVLEAPQGIAHSTDRAMFYVSETGSHTIRWVDVSSEPWTTGSLAGGRDLPGRVDGSLSDSRFNQPTGLALDRPQRYLYVADSGNHVIRRIDLDADPASPQALITLFGTGGRGRDGDGGAASDAWFNVPSGVAVGVDGSVYVADTENHRVRRVVAYADGSVDGASTIETVIGTGSPSFSGAGEPAAAVSISSPLGVVVDAWGNLFVTSDRSVRLVDAGDDGIATGSDRVLLIFGADLGAFPASSTYCLAGLSFEPGASDTLVLSDRCSGYIMKLSRASRDR